MMTETDVDVLMWNNIQAVLFTKIKNRVQNNVQEMIYLCVSQKVLHHIDFWHFNLCLTILQLSF